MGFLEAVDVYFRGEKQVGAALIPVGIVVLGLGIYFWRWYGGGLGKGVGVPFAVVGLLAAFGGGFLIKTVSARQVRLTEAYADQSDEPVRAEQVRMNKVNANWPVLKATWAGLIVAALGVLLWVKRDWATGLALALICVCALALVIDTFAERRAEIYTERIAP
jgi:multisubunit Na+/H+ antiporter MnhG subunit